MPKAAIVAPTDDGGEFVITISEAKPTGEIEMAMYAKDTKMSMRLEPKIWRQVITAIEASLSERD